ncbi:MAG: murein biosynthesis integral membrane protein MurJ [Rhodospirillales bacterium]|nr:murein biosynthesis integral membrane protein MurJ [Rhodospirillales bacterium]
MKLAKAMATVAGLTGLSRIFGFIRDIMTAAILGAGPVADAFFVALKLPNFFRRVTAEGAFSVAFVPLYTEMAEKDGREQADAFASNAFMVMLSILSVVVLAGLAGMPWVISAIAPGFIGDAVRFEAAVELSRVTFPYLLLMSLTALLGGVLNALNRFAPFAFAPVLFNVCLISTLLFSGYFANAGEALSYGVLGAGVLQLVWLVVAARRSGVRLRFKRPVFDLKIRRVFKLMGPGVIGAGVIHINLFADMIIASFLGAGSISYLYYADRLNQLPLGVVGIAVGTALLPMLSKALAKGDMDEGRDLFNRALEMCLLLALPAAAALAFFGRDLVGGLFERGAFDYQDSQATVMVLTGYALGLPAYICVKVFSTVHWASQDTKTPVKISVIATVINIALSLLLIQYIGVAGIALATGLTGWLQFIFHVKALKGKRVEFDDRLKRASLKIFWATGLMVGGVVFLMLAIDNDYEMSKMQRMIITVVSGLGIYSVFVFVFGLVNLDQLKRFLKKKKV